jgi:sterol desaturase/sphingolipid hydroxylase (fatty acid hydroxylase superfamily)
MEQFMYFLNADFWKNPTLVCSFVACLFIIVFVRYLALSWIYSQWLHFYRQKNRDRIASKRQRKEIYWAICSSAIFACLTAAMFWLYQQDYTRVYTDIKTYGWLYFTGSIMFVLLLYETYYYWLHRWMHLPKVFKVVHKIHHESIHTSAFTSFSFHPVEALLQFMLLPVIVMMIPLHYAAIFIVLSLMTISAIINHAGEEIYPRWFRRHPIARWLIGSTHHDLHHKEFNSNFGLCFTLWDWWMNTESRTYQDQFRRNTSKNINRSR